MRLVARMGSDETMVVTSVGICFAFAMGAERPATRSRWALSWPARWWPSRARPNVGRAPCRAAARPFRGRLLRFGRNDDRPASHRDSIGMRSRSLRRGPIVGKIVGVSLGALLAGTPAPLAVQTGLSLAQIGEFSFIIAGVGIETGAAHSFLFAIAVAVSAITTFTTPFMIRACGPVGAMLERRAPQALARLQGVYDGWVERVNAGRLAPDGRPGVAAPAFFLFGGALCIAAAVIAVDIAERPIERAIISSGMPTARATTIADLLALGVAVIGTAAMLFGARQLAARLAEHRPHIAVSRCRTGRRGVMVEILQLAIMVLCRTVAARGAAAIFTNTRGPGGRGIDGVRYRPGDLAWRSPPRRCPLLALRAHGFDAAGQGGSKDGQWTAIK